MQRESRTNPLRNRADSRETGCSVPDGRMAGVGLNAGGSRFLIDIGCQHGFGENDDRGCGLMVGAVSSALGPIFENRAFDHSRAHACPMLGQGSSRHRPVDPV